MQPNPGLYVHLPWCVKKCPYCDFNSHTLRQNAPKDAYVDALVADLKQQVLRFEPPRLASIFFGGGTPSLFSAKQIGRVLETAEQLIGFTDTIEITLEANPGTTEHDSFVAYRDAGVNRISLGVQSFSNAQLKKLGRIHDADQAVRASAAVLESGINRLNLDLMYGLPEQTPDMALNDVEQALGLSPSHLSHYNLTIEPNTLFAVQKPQLPDSDVCFEMQDACTSLLESAGYAQYEVSAYAKDGQASRHNLNYWTFGDYLGIGAGAHGKISQDKSVTRTVKARHPTQYLSNCTELTENKIGDNEQMFEFMLNRLRLKRAVNIPEYVKMTGQTPTELEKKLAKAQIRGLMAKISVDEWQTTTMGWRFLNDLQEIFLP